MFFIPQANFGAYPTGAGVVSFDAYGQATYHQPLEVVSVVPTAAGIAGAANLASAAGRWAQGVAGIALGSGAVWSGQGATCENEKRKRRGGKRQVRKQDKTEAQEPQEPEDTGYATWDEFEMDSEQPLGRVEWPPEQSMPATTAVNESQFDSEGMAQLGAQLAGAGGEEGLEEALLSMHSQVLPMAFDASGCRLLQTAFEVASQKHAGELLKALQGHVRTAMEDKHANYVVQKVIEVLPTAMTRFVAEELLGSALDVARHRYGCRILCRLVEHSSLEPTTISLVKELITNVQDIKELSRHAYGYHVERAILEHGEQEDRRAIGSALVGGALRHAKHRHASFVVEKALAYCDDATREQLASDLLSRPAGVAELAKHQFGRHVVAQLVRAPGSCSERAIRHLNDHAAQVKGSKHGRRLVEELRPLLYGDGPLARA